MPLAVPLAPGDLTAQGDDVRLAVELFPPALTTPPFTLLLRFECCHGCPPQYSHGVFMLTMMSMAVYQPVTFLTAKAITNLLPPLDIQPLDHGSPSCSRSCRASRACRRR
jgi:hypothetical protein